MNYNEQYYFPYKDLCEKGYQIIYTKDLNAGNIDQHFYSIINILKDGIETDEVKKMQIHVEFENDSFLEFSIFDYCINLMFWELCTTVNHPIWDVHTVFFEDITKKSIKEYIDNIFIDKYRKQIPFILLNQKIDNVSDWYILTTANSEVLATKIQHMKQLTWCVVILINILFLCIYYYVIKIKKDNL